MKKIEGTYKKERLGKVKKGEGNFWACTRYEGEYNGLPPSREK